jgi:hypothetical protein
MAHYTGGTIEIVYPYHDPNEGRDIWNRNFRLLDEAVHFSITGSTSGHTVVESGNSNIIVTDSGATVPPIYQVSTADDVIFNSISATTISAGTYYVGSTPITSYFSALTTASNGLTSVSNNVTLGGVLTGDTYIDNATYLFRTNEFSAATMSADTMYLTSTSAAQVIMPPVNASAPVDGSMWFTTSGGTTFLNYQVTGTTKSVELT